jgi:NADPH-dependent 2,4-dienoyl-CoA reductase/sulfur reductase-like enzyme
VRGWVFEVLRHVIIGNGSAGVVAAETLRHADTHADITLIGDEPEPPYSRMAIPYLLMGRIDESGTDLRKQSGHFERLQIRMLRGRFEAIDSGRREVRLADGSTLPFDRLLVATGAAAATASDSGNRVGGGPGMLDAG